VVEDERLRVWEILFQRALVLIDDARAQGLPVDEWTFGGGTVLMRRHYHRLSKDVDIFINDPQFLGYLTPRLSRVAESLTTNYDEDTRFVKLAFPEGEIDFVASAPLTATPAKAEELFGRPFLVETSTEIVAKKIWHRGEEFTARDIFDLAMVAELEPAALREIAPILRDRRDVVLARIERYEALLRETFDALVVLNYRRSFDECLEIVRDALARSAKA
jgi:nucleotidyltransferase AbiEii toxin of type IV toxin-antitoxin system